MDIICWCLWFLWIRYVLGYPTLPNSFRLSMQSLRMSFSLVISVNVVLKVKAAIIVFMIVVVYRQVSWGEGIDQTGPVEITDKWYKRDKPCSSLSWPHKQSHQPTKTGDHLYHFCGKSLYLSKENYVYWLRHYFVSNWGFTTTSRSSI